MIKLNENTSFEWKITYTDNINENTFSADKNIYYNHVNNQFWTTTSLNTLIEIIKDIIDAPFNLLTLEQIKEDFGSLEYTIDEEKLKQIQSYYNDRYSLQEYIFNDINKFIENSSENSISSFVYKFPKKCYDYIFDNVEKHTNINLVIDVKPNYNI